MKRRYYSRVFGFYLRENQILKNKSIGKSLSKLTVKDFKRSFIAMYWTKFSGVSGGFDVNGKKFLKEDLENLIVAIHKKAI